MSERLRTDYDKLAALYDVDRAHWQIDPDPLIEELLAENRSSLRVLDVGCGTGIYLSAQRRHFEGLPVVWCGVDASSEMLSVATGKSAGLLAQARAEALPIATKQIDYVYTSFAFHHFTDKDKALDEIARTLRAGGRFRMHNMDPWGQPGWWLYEYFDGTWETDGKRFWPVERIQRALEARGFRVEARVDRETTMRTVADVLEEAGRRVVSQLSILDDEAYENGMARLRALPAEGTIPYERGRLRVTATKR